MYLRLGTWIAQHLPPGGDVQGLGKITSEAQALRQGTYGRSLDSNKNVDNNTHYDAFENVYVSGNFKNPDISINAVSLEQCDDD